MTKTNITKTLNTIVKSKPNWTMCTFNSNRKMPIGARGFVDHIIMTPNYIITIEVKLGADRLSDKQKAVGEILSKNANNNTNNMYYQLTEKNAEYIFKDLRSMF